MKLFCTLMLVSVQVATFLFALHAPARSSAAVLQASHHQPPISGFWDAGAFSSSSSVWCSHVFGHRVSGLWIVQPSAPVAESSTAATGSAAYPPSTSPLDGQKVRRTFASGHFEEGQKAPCAEKKLQPQRGSSSGRLCLCMKKQFSHQIDYCRTLTKIVTVGIAPQFLACYPSEYITRVMNASGILMLKDHVQTEG